MLLLIQDVYLGKLVCKIKKSRYCKKTLEMGELFIPTLSCHRTIMFIHPLASLYRRDRLSIELATSDMIRGSYVNT